ncbi:MAG: hypothetical protein SPJ25_04145, partial [Prevotella sp.]|nr:hypothetical protein [Prevotella sp.]
RHWESRHLACWFSSIKGTGRAGILPAGSQAFKALGEQASCLLILKHQRHWESRFLACSPSASSPQTDMGRANKDLPFFRRSRNRPNA